MCFKPANQRMWWECFWATKLTYKHSTWKTNICYSWRFFEVPCWLSGFGSFQGDCQIKQLQYFYIPAGNLTAGLSSLVFIGRINIIIVCWMYFWHKVLAQSLLLLVYGTLLQCLRNSQQLVRFCVQMWQACNHSGARPVSQCVSTESMGVFFPSQKRGTARLVLDGLQEHVEHVYFFVIFHVGLRWIPGRYHGMQDENRGMTVSETYPLVI